MLNFFRRIIAMIQAFFFSIFPQATPVATVYVDTGVTYQTVESFGTSSAWWSQTIDNAETAGEIARLLYDDETGLCMC